jgi:ribonuclease VapC
VAEAGAGGGAQPGAQAGAGSGAKGGAKPRDKAAAVVLDASALLALFNDEPGAERVMQALEQPCLLSAANHTEVLTKLLDKGLSPQDAATVMASVELRIVAFDAAQSADAAWLRPATRAVGLSLGDRACLALARAEGAAVLTADKPWLQVAQAVGVRVQCIR